MKVLFVCMVVLWLLLLAAVQAQDADARQVQVKRKLCTHSQALKHPNRCVHGLWLAEPGDPVIVLVSK